MATRIEDYMDQLFEGTVSPHAGFLGAYNMGVWGVSVSGRHPFHEGLLASGELLERVPGRDNSRIAAQNWVKFYDTPDLWGYGDDEALDNALTQACAVLDISRENGVSKTESAQLKSFLKTHYGMEWDGNLGTPWSEVAKKSDIQAEMNRVGAWSKLVNRWKAVIAQSRYLVDITSLSPPVPGSEAQIAICAGISQCLKSWAAAAKQRNAPQRRLMIRILFGMTAVQRGMKTFWKEFQDELQNKLLTVSPLVSGTRASQLPVVLYGSDMGKIVSTFNHSKIVAGDGQYAVVGGHNMCEEVSSNTAPVIHDITSEVTGPGARTANTFAGSLWLKAAESGRLYIHRFNWKDKKFDDLSSQAAKKWAPKNWSAYDLGKQDEVPKVLKDQFWYYPMQEIPTKPKAKAPPGSVRATAIMGIGRWGDTKVFGESGKGLKLDAEIPHAHACQYASDQLKRLMIMDRSNTVIRMSQQDLINNGNFGMFQGSYHTICQILGKRLKATGKGTAIQIVVSSRFSQNSEGLAYSYGDGPREAVERISDTIMGVGHASSDPEHLPERLAVLDVYGNPGSAPVHAVESPSDPSFCTVAPLAFCEANGATRDRGSYVWPGVKYVWDRLYSNNRFWEASDTDDMTFGPGNHAKVMCVSRGNRDATGLVMIGSDNMYPSPLSEFNFVIEGAEAIRLFRTQYWDKLWRYSARLGFTVHPDGTVT